MSTCFTKLLRNSFFSTPSISSYKRYNLVYISWYFFCIYSWTDFIQNCLFSVGTAADTEQGYAPIWTPSYQRSLVWRQQCRSPPYRFGWKKHRDYIIALIDDASRFITGIDVFYNDNFINLMSVMRSAIAKYGRPKIFNFDNGKSYKNKQMELPAARIGTTLSY